jgi:hypothetical protein
MLTMDPPAKAALRNAFALYLAWVAATYLLEGLPGTLVRPEAVGLRLAYAVVANLAIGILLALWLIRRALQHGVGTAADYGFSGIGRALASIAAGAVIGFGLFSVSNSGFAHPTVVLNAFAQVWVVSVAEIVVCWALVGGTLHAALRPWSRAGAIAVAAVTASVLFGVYHFAHSAPFNDWKMVAFLTGIGFATGLWWFVSRDVYGTAVFHNFFGVTGVLAALKAAGLVPEEPALAVPLMVTALVVTVALVWPGIAWILRRQAAVT